MANPSSEKTWSELAIKYGLRIELGYTYDQYSKASFFDNNQLVFSIRDHRPYWLYSEKHLYIFQQERLSYIDNTQPTLEPVFISNKPFQTLKEELFK